MASGLGTHLALAHLKVGLVVGGACGVHANLEGLLAERLTLNARRTALGTHGGLALERAHLDAARHRIGHVAVGPAHAANEAAAGLGARFHNQVLAALGASAHARIGRDGVADGVAQLLRVFEQLVEHASQQRARVRHDMLFGILAALHTGHVAIELAGHIGARDARGKLRQCIDDGDAQLTRLHGIVFEVAHGVQALDDARACGLGAQAALFHLLHELALAVARGRLSLLGLEFNVEHVDRIALLQRRHLLIALESIRIRLAETRGHEHIARSHERLTVHVELELGVLDGRGPHERCQKAAGDEVVELTLAAVERGRIALARGIDRRVVGGLDFAPRGLHGAGEHLFAYRCQRRIDLCQVAHHGAQVERRGVHGVVDTRVADEARHVEGLGDAHGTRRRDALGCGGSLQRSGRKRRGRLLLARTLGHRGDGCRRNAVDMAVRRLGSIFVGKARRLVSDLKAIILGSTLRGAHAANLPIVLGHKRHALALALNHQGERRCLHAAGRTHVAKAAKLGERQVAREHRAPNEVDVLTALAGVGKILVERDEIIEGLRDLGLGKRRVLGAGNRQVRRNLAHLVESVRADQLALAVEVRGDDDAVGLLGKVLERANELLLGRQLNDGRPGEIGQTLELPALDGNAIGKERFTLCVVGRTRQAIGHVGRQHLAVLGDRIPSQLFIEQHTVAKIGRKDVTGQADGHALLALPLKTVDGGVVHLILFGFTRGQTLGDLTRGVVFLGDDELQKRLLSRVSAATPARMAADLRPCLLDLPDEPIAPGIHALALARAHGKPRRLRIEVIECLSIPIHVKIESRGHVDLIEQLRAGVLEDARVLDGLVVALGHREDHDGQVLAQVKVDWADQVTHVFDKDDVDVLKTHSPVEGVNGLHDHVALEMAQAARVDLDGGHAGFLHGDGVDIRGDIALDDGTAQAGLVT